jgi:hypothetical protein
VAISDPYATNTQYKAFVAKSSGDNDSEIDAQLLAISRVLERDAFGGRYFTKDASATIRRYYPLVDNQRTLFVEDIASTSGLIVKVDDNRDGIAEVTLTLTTDYELRPLNAATGPEPEPYTAIYLPPRSSRSFWWNLIEVTAIHGWPAVPQAVVQATCQLVGILRLDSPRATNRINEGMDAVIGTSREARDIVDRLSEAYAKPAWVYA